MQFSRASCCEYDGKLMETDTTSEFPNGGKDISEQIVASEEINKSKRAGLWEPQSRIQVGKLTIWVRSFEICSYDGRYSLQSQTHLQTGWSMLDEIE